MGFKWFLLSILEMELLENFVIFLKKNVNFLFGMITTYLLFLIKGNFDARRHRLIEFYSAWGRALLPLEKQLKTIWCIKGENLGSVSSMLSDINYKALPDDYQKEIQLIFHMLSVDLIEKRRIAAAEIDELISGIFHGREQGKMVHRLSVLDLMQEIPNIRTSQLSDYVVLDQFGYPACGFQGRQLLRSEQGESYEDLLRQLRTALLTTESISRYRECVNKVETKVSWMNNEFEKRIVSPLRVKDLIAFSFRELK